MGALCRYSILDNKGHLTKDLYRDYDERFHCFYYPNGFHIHFFQSFLIFLL